MPELPPLRFFKSGEKGTKTPMIYVLRGEDCLGGIKDGNFKMSSEVGTKLDLKEMKLLVSIMETGNYPKEMEYVNETVIESKTPTLVEVINGAEISNLDSGKESGEERERTTIDDRPLIEHSENGSENEGQGRAIG